MGCELKKKKAFQLHVTVRKDHSSLDYLCQNRLWLFLPAKIGSEIQKTTWLWIYRLQTRSQYFVIHNHTKKKKKQMEDVTLWIHWCHLYIICISRRSLFYFFNAVFLCRWCKVRAPSGDFHTFMLLCCLSNGRLCWPTCTQQTTSLHNCTIVSATGQNGFFPLGLLSWLCAELIWQGMDPPVWALYDVIGCYCTFGLCCSEIDPSMLFQTLSCSHSCICLLRNTFSNFSSLLLT